MADHTSIEWTDATWNPITGCSVLSPGCTNCYAMKLAGTRMKHHESRAGLTVETKAGPVWNGNVRFNKQWLTQPLQWKRPRRVFVCAHADLFHEAVPDAWIDCAFAVMALSPQHTFQVLTKRSKRMREYMNAYDARRLMVAKGVLDQWVAGNGKHLICDGGDYPLEDGRADDDPAIKSWPIPNVWLGVSVEDQKRADERIPDLLATPAAVRWISAEPLLGPVDLRDMDINAHLASRQLGLIGGYWINALTGANDDMGRPCPDLPKLDWVVVGGESGHNARPMHPDWARSLRDQCAAAGVPFLFKQWGEWGHADQVGSDNPALMRVQSDAVHKGRTDQVTHIGYLALGKIGKKAAGRLLDGVEHNGMPKAFGGSHA